MQDKNSKLISQTTRNEPEQGFVLFRSDTIQLWSWLEGNQQLDDQSLKSLSEDISYRIRESLDNAVSLMHQCKRSELKTSDVNQAFKILNIEKIFGYGSTEPLDYQTIRTDNLSDKVLNQFKSKFFELNDPVIELKLSEKISNEKKKNILHGNWFVVNGNSVDYRKNDNNFNVTIDFNQSENEDIESNFFYPQINQDFKEYYEKVVTVIMGDHECNEEDQELLNMVMEDFKTNPKLQPIVPYLINFFHQTIQILTVNISDSKKEIVMLDYLDRVLNAVKNLILNRNVFLAPKGYFTKILSTLLFSSIQNSHLGCYLSLEIRQKSSFILVMFLKLYERFSSETIKYILASFIKPTLIEATFDKKHLNSLIGVSALLFNFGGQIIDEFYVEIFKLVIELDKMCCKSNPLVVIVKQMFLECLARHFKWMLRKNIYDFENINYSINRILDIYKKVYSLFGESFSNQILNLHESFRYKKIFDMKLKTKKEICDNFNIKLKSLSNGLQVEKKEMQDIFENYSVIHKKNIDIKYGKNVHVKQSKFLIKNEPVLPGDKNIYCVKYVKSIKKDENYLEQNLSFFYRDTFL